MKEVKKTLYPNKTPPPGSEERENDPPTPFEQRMQHYEIYNPYDSYFSTAHHMGFDTQHVGQSIHGFDAPSPPPSRAAKTHHSR
jgi:hypothetical protein